MKRGWRWLFWGLALSFVGGAIFHASAALDATVEPRMGPAGHLIFVGVNLAMVAGMLWRPRGFAILFAIFCLQQLVSHGDWAWQAWRAGWLDWRSFLTMGSLPLMLAALLLEPRVRTTA